MFIFFIRFTCFHNTFEHNIPLNFIFSWIIRARCTRNSGILPFMSKKMNQDGTYGMVSRCAFDFKDDSSRITAIAFGNDADKWEKNLEVGQVYTLERAAVKDAFNKTKGYSTFEITITEETLVNHFLIFIIFYCIHNFS